MLHKHCTLFLLSMLHLSCLHSLGLSISCQPLPHQHSAHHQAVSTAADETLLRAVNQTCFSYLLRKYFVSKKQRTWATMDQSLVFTLLQGKKALNRKRICFIHNKEKKKSTPLGIFAFWFCLNPIYFLTQ